MPTTGGSQPTDPPPPVPGLPGLGRTPVLVTGGTGTLGRKVVEELRRSQVPARVLTRKADPARSAQTEGDLATGAGLSQAVDSVQAVIHCASNAAHAESVDIEGTKRLCRALELHNPSARLVYVSIVGCWDNPLSYYQAKADTETVVTRSGRPHTIVRATQFHEFVERLCRYGRIGPVGIGMRGLRFAPCDTSWLAARLVDAALDESEPGKLLEYAGPQTHSARDLAVLTAHVRGRRTPRVIPLPAVGGIMKAFAAGSNLPGPDAVRGGPTYAQWLSKH